MLALLDDAVAFLPGLDHCCGDTPLFMGDPEEAARVMDDLVSAIAAYEPEAAVFWCPTCLYRTHTTVSEAYRLSFATMSLPQFLAARLDRLDFSEPFSAKATVHDACKIALTGLDVDGPRPLLASVPGLELVEMERTGSEAACCGSGAIT